MLDVSLTEPRIRARDLHLWADYIELCCLSSLDRDAGAEELLREHWDSRSGLAGIVSGAGVCDCDSDSELDSPEISDRFAVKLHDLLAYLKTRELLFGDDYPFAVDTVNKCITLKSEVGPSHTLYVFFLCAANLRFFDKSTQQVLTHDFEALCADRSRAIWPTWLEFRIFGTSEHPQIKGYAGKKYEKLCSLAVDLNSKMRALEHEFSSSDTGDAGLDIVAWMPVDDAPHLPVFFMQCGCTADEDEMIKKQDSVSHSVWCHVLQYCIPYGFMFTPACYRDANGIWPKPSAIRSIFFDRVRIMRVCCLAGSTPVLSIKSLEIASAALHGPMSG